MKKTGMNPRAPAQPASADWPGGDSTCAPRCRLVYYPPVAHMAHWSFREIPLIFQCFYEL